MNGAILNLIVGIWLMISPALLGYGKPVSINDYIIGPLVVSFAIISFSEATRTVNKWNLVLGAWLIFAPWVILYNQTTPTINSMICGILIILFSLFRENAKKSFAGGWSSLWKR